jgi:hypothetical protein
MDLNTYFYNEKQERFASMPGLVPVFKGMILKVREGSFIVEDVQINLNNHSRIDGEELGLQVFCKPN